MAASFQQLKDQVESKYSKKKGEKLEKIWKRLAVGALNPGEALENISEPGIREEFEHILHNEWIDLANGSVGYRGNGFREHRPSMKNLPYQGYKLRVSADPQDAREVAAHILPELRKDTMPHKVSEDIAHLAGLTGSQRGKFITIYPRLDDGKLDEISVEGPNREGDTVRLHKFWKSNETKNKTSINGNKENTERLIERLVEILNSSSVGLNGGRTPETDVQIGKTRLSYRYGVIAKKNGFFSEGERLDGNHLVDKNGDQEKDNRSTKGKDNWRTLKGRERLNPRI